MSLHYPIEEWKRKEKYSFINKTTRKNKNNTSDQFQETNNRGQWKTKVNTACRQNAMPISDEIKENNASKNLAKTETAS